MDHGNVEYLGRCPWCEGRLERQDTGYNGGRPKEYCGQPCREFASVLGNLNRVTPTLNFVDDGHAGLARGALWKMGNLIHPRVGPEFGRGWGDKFRERYPGQVVLPANRGTCRVCGLDIPASGARGRPRVYCQGLTCQTFYNSVASLPRVLSRVLWASPAAARRGRSELWAVGNAIAWPVREAA